MVDKVQQPKPPADKPPAKSHHRKAPKISKGQTDALVQLLNIPLAFISPGDVLEETECAALSKALCDTAASNPWFAKLLNGLFTAQTSTELVSVVGAIVARRLAWRGVIPEIADTFASGVISSVATVGTPVARRKHRKRENNDSGEGPAAAELHDSPDIETGLGSVAGLAERDEGESDSLAA